MDEMSISEIMVFLKSGDPEKQREGAFAARDKGLIDAAPQLVELLKSESLGVQEAADMALRKIGREECVQALIPLLRSDLPQVRNLAMDILRHIGHQDLDSLIELLNDEDEDMRIFASDILGSSGSYLAVSPLCNALLQDKNVNVRYQAAVSLGELGRSEASSCLNKAFKDEEWVQYAVVEALAKLRDESSIQALIKALADSSELVTSMIVDALGELGNVKAVPMLLKKTETSPTALRNKIVKSIIKVLGGKALAFLSEKERDKLNDYLLVALEDNDPETQDVAMAGLGYVGGEKASAKIITIAAELDSDRDSERLERAENALVSIGYSQALADGLTAEDESKAFVAVRALGRIGGKDAINRLTHAFEVQSRDLQRAITREIYNTGGSEARDFFLHILRTHEDGDVLKNSLKFIGYKLKDDECISELMSFLDHPWNDVKETALDSVLTIGGEAVAAQFRPMITSADPMKRLMAVYAVGRLGAGKNLDILKKALTDDSPDVRKMALDAMATVCPDDKEIIPAAIKVINDENREVRLALVELLGKCPHEETVAYLLESLEDQDEWVRIRAIEALGDKKSSRVTSEIISLWDNSSKLQKIKIIEALGTIGGQVCFRALLDILDDPDTEIQDAAERALDILQEQGME
ncbi:HEAT repeat domain-containing protein [Desulfonatronovibrio magnus]|uniref:HEAT repeat domain-containing protein n=1 Tax=Desulfonatronovibrio magnus TaxID=698827 RepID=UPI000A4EA300|nr:HEAT repeat domain-containing protein [Desulfonatronovibrio magnus]